MPHSQNLITDLLFTFYRSTVGCVGITCLALSLRFAYASLMHKINARHKAAAASCNGSQSPRVTHTGMDMVEDIVFEVPYQNGFAINGESVSL